MKLLSLSLTNFKGQKFFLLDPQGQDISVFGDNAVGKTTLADAYCWLLFGKDSQNRADFEIKTLGADGQPMPRLDHSVAADFDLGSGQTLTLKRLYKETWVKQRGRAEAEFSGHTTEFWIDGVPTQKKDYEARIAGLASEQRFRLLSDPYHFNVNLPWQDRRKILLEVCGDVSDADVIASDTKLAPLPAILGARSLEDHRKVLAAQRTETNKQIEILPVRIDELTRSLPESSESAADPRPIEKEIADLAAERARIVDGGQIAQIRKDIAQANVHRSEIELHLRKKASGAYDEAVAVARSKGQEWQAASDAAAALDRQITHLRTALRLAEQDVAKKREDYALEKSRVFAYPEGQETCPSCGQSLPQDQVEASRTKAEEEFNLARGRKLEGLVAEGQGLAAKVSEIQGQIAALEADAEAAKAKALAIQEEHAALRQKADALVTGPVELSADPEYAALSQSIEELARKVSALETGNAAALSEIDARAQEASGRLRQAQEAAARIQSAQATKARIAELEAEHKHLAVEAERIAREIWLCEEFVKAKVKMLTERINSRFQIARFRLFEQQVNGGISEVCECQVEGVPFGSLNHGMRLNAGLDIIRTLSEHWGFAPPIIIDNAESVTSILPTPGQQIRLVVSAPDKALRVELDAAKETVSA